MQVKGMNAEGNGSCVPFSGHRDKIRMTVNCDCVSGCRVSWRAIRSMTYNLFCRLTSSFWAGFFDERRTKWLYSREPVLQS